MNILEVQHEGQTYYLDQFGNEYNKVESATGLTFEPKPLAGLGRLMGINWDRIKEGLSNGVSAVTNIFSGNNNSEASQTTTANTTPQTVYVTNPNSGGVSIQPNYNQLFLIAGGVVGLIILVVALTRNNSAA